MSLTASPVLAYPSATHARWFMEVVSRVSRSGQENGNADALSRNPQGEAPCSPQEEEVQVAMVNTSEVEIQELLNSNVSQCADQ